MAHVGTTTNLKQPAATGSEQRTGVWMAVFAAAVVAAIALAFVMTQLVGSKTASGSLAGDRSYDQIEAQRGAVLSAAGDRSYDQIEAQRGGSISHQTSSTVRRPWRSDVDRPAGSLLRLASPGLAGGSPRPPAQGWLQSRHPTVSLGVAGRGPEPKLRSSSAVRYRRPRLCRAVFSRPVIARSLRTAHPSPRAFDIEAPC